MIGNLRGHVDFKEYKWGNPQLVRERARANYQRIVEHLKTFHQREDWAVVRTEAAIRRNIFADALVVVHGRTVDQAANIYHEGRIRPLASFGDLEIQGLGHNHTRALDLDLELHQYSFFSFRFDPSFGEVYFVFSNKLCDNQNFFVTPDDISAFIDCDSYDGAMRSSGSGTHQLSSFLKMQGTLNGFMNKIISGADYIDLLSILSVLEFKTFEDSVKYFLRGGTHYGASLAGVKCGCLWDIGALSHYAEGKIFGGTDLALLEEIVVNHPNTKERLIARGLPADLIIVLWDTCDSYEERFRLQKTSFREIGQPQIRGMIPWSEINDVKST